MGAQTGYRYDVFVSYNAADQDWVATVLLPRLEAAGLRVAIDYRDFVVGKPLVENIEDVVTASRRTIVVLSPAWVASEWNAFEALLLRAEDPAATRRKLLPLRLRPCDLPAGLAKLKLDVADLTAERYKEAQLKRLVRDVEDVVPVPLPAQARDWDAWRRWLRRYRRGVRWGVAGVVLLALALAMLLQITPFQPRQVWVQVAGPFRDAWVVHDTGRTLLVGARNEAPGCDLKEQGIWYQAADGRFSASEIAPSLCIEAWKPKGMSAIVAFASDPAYPGTIYALTSHSGVLVSYDDGAHFDQAAPPPLPSVDARGVSRFGVQFREPVTFWATGRGNGIWRYQRGAWARLDDGGPAGCAGLPLVEVRSLLAHGDRVLIGTVQQGLWVTEDGGLTCRGVFDADPPSQYEFLDLAALEPAPLERYLVLAWDNMAVGARPGQVFELCARPGICTPARWQADPVLWETGALAAQVVVQPGQDAVRWYAVAETPTARVWRGGLGASGRVDALPGVWRCFGERCRAALAATGAGQTPYLLAAGRIYRYEVGPWWRSVWP